MAPRVLFLVRDKLGDTLIASALAVAWARQNPGVSVSLMVRSAYVPFLAGETSVRVVPYANSMQAFCFGLLSRTMGRSYDALVVLRGFGERVARFGRVTRAKRKIYFNSRLAPAFPEYPPALSREEEEQRPIWDATCRSLRVLSPDYCCPSSLSLPNLARRWRPVDGFIGIFPVTDEPRKNLSIFALKAVIRQLKSEFPGRPLRILIRHEGEGGFCEEMVDGVSVVCFLSIEGLLEQFSTMGQYVGADTGPFHVAAAMGIPARIFFGPTQPQKIIFPQQDAEGWRVFGLGQAHCDEKGCRTPVCIDQAALNFSKETDCLPLSESLPQKCPLRAVEPSGRTKNRFYRNGSWSEDV